MMKALEHFAFVIVLMTAPSTALSGSLSFEAHTVKDTFLTYEKLWVKFIARNNSGQDVEYRPLEIDDTFIRHEIYDRDGKVVGISGVVTFYVPGVNSKPPVIPPGDSIWRFDSFERKTAFYEKTAFYDSVARLIYLPAGQYQAIFRWRYDPYGRALFNGQAVLVDSVAFVVVDPTGRMAAARDAYLDLYRKKLLSNNHVDARWKCYSMYPDTPYGERVLSALAGLVSGGSLPPPTGLTAIEVVQEFAVKYPNNPRVKTVMRRIARTLNRSGEGALTFLETIRDSVPNTIAGRLAVELLTKEE